MSCVVVEAFISLHCFLSVWCFVHDLVDEALRQRVDVLGQVEHCLEPVKVEGLIIYNKNAVDMNFLMTIWFVCRTLSILKHIRGYTALHDWVEVLV